MTAYEQATATTGTSTDRPVTETAKKQAGEVAGTAKEQAGAVAGTATQAASDVAGTAKEQVAQVADEAKSQIGTLASQARQQVSDQAAVQTQKAAQTVRGLADQLQSMARGESTEGAATDIVRSISERVQEIADRLENAEPTELLEDVRRFARNKPGMFLMGAVAAGFVGGRLVKGATADDGDSASYADSRYRPATAGGSYAGGSYASGQSATDRGWTSPGQTGTAYGAGFGEETYPEEPRQTDVGGAF